MTHFPFLFFLGKNCLNILTIGSTALVGYPVFCSSVYQTTTWSSTCGFLLLTALPTTQIDRDWSNLLSVNNAFADHKCVRTKEKSNIEILWVGKLNEHIVVTWRNGLVSSMQTWIMLRILVPIPQQNLNSNMRQKES